MNAPVCAMPGSQVQREPARGLELPVDPVLPQLARALDPVAMAAVFALPLRQRSLTVERCEVERIKYRPGRNCTLSYRLSLRDARTGELIDQRVAARLGTAADATARQARAATLTWVDSLAGPSLLPVPGLHMLTWWWPNDAKLRATRVLGDATRLGALVIPEVAGVLGAPSASATHTIAIAQYVPEHRVTAQVDLQWQRDGHPFAQRVYAKASREPEGAVAHAQLRALQDSPAWRAGRLRTPRAWLWQPEWQLHWQEGLPGQALLDVGPVEAARLAPALGAQLAALHGTPVPTSRAIDLASLRARLAEVNAVLAPALPAASGALRQASARLAHGLRWLDAAPVATLHGDLHPRNVLADGDRLALIDLDGLRRGPTLLELGAWVADGIYRAVLDGAPPMRDAPAWRALLDGYGHAGGRVPAEAALAWSAAWSLLTQRVWRCVVNLKPGRYAIAPALVVLAARLAVASSLEAA